MKNSNRYKDIFSSKKSLTQEDIESYEQVTGSTKNTIEQKMENDSFEKDAMEGWKQLNYDTSLLSAMNKKLFPKNQFSWGTAFSALAIGVVSVLTIQYFLSEAEPVKKIVQKENTAPEEENTINIESADVILPAAIEKMKEVAENEQINASLIINDFEKMENLIAKLPPLKPSEIQVNDVAPKIVRNRLLAKEIYLHDLKLVDYSTYRTDPVVQTKQLILNGLPANMENKNSESYNSNWENVEIPYMQYLEKSLYYFNKGKNKKALARFETILESYPQDVNANFYGGLCLFNLGEYSKAISYFKNCSTSDYKNFDEEANWISALSYENLNNTTKANEIFREIVASNTYYSEQAKEKLK